MSIVPIDKIEAFFVNTSNPKYQLRILFYL